MKKYQIYTIIALVLMTVCFTIPVLGWFGAKAKIAAGEPIAGYSYKIYDLYTSFQYKNHLMPDDVKASLQKAIEQKAEIGTPSFPIQTTQKTPFRTAFPFISTLTDTAATYTR